MKRLTPEQADVDALRELLDLMAVFPDNDQRARFLLSSNWMRDRGAVAAAALADLQRPRRVCRYVITETWGDVPEWVTKLFGEPDAYLLSEYRGVSSTWEVEKGGKIVYGFAGDYAGVSPVAMAQGVDA